MSDYPYYDREGHLIGREDWIRLRADRSDDAYLRVGSTHIGETWISTVWLGIDHSFGNGPPIIFETMVFGGSLGEEIERYATEEEAWAGHEAMVERVRIQEMP